MTTHAQMARLAEAFGAAPYDPPFCDPPFGRAWRFWDFTLLLERDGRHTFNNAEAETPRHRVIDRFTIAGAADEINRRPVVVTVGGDSWRVTPVAEVVGGWVRNARVFLSCRSRDFESGATVAVLDVSRRDDPAGWPLAIGALYHRQLGPLVDHALESPLYRDAHDRLWAAWSASVASVGTFSPE